MSVAPVRTVAVAAFTMLLVSCDNYGAHGSISGSVIIKDASAPLAPSVPRADAGMGKSDVATGAQSMAQQAAVPILMIETTAATVGEEEGEGQLKTIDDADLPRDDVDALLKRAGTVETKIAIKVRGNSSSRYAKKSFSIELRRDDAPTGNRALALLGLSKDPDWVLYACYVDKTCLRNALIYSVGQSLGRWTPRYRFVEVYLNGSYWGLYNLVEKIKLDPNRLNLPRAAADATMGDISGAYIVKRDGPGDGPGSTWTSTQGTVFTLHSPNERNISQAQRQYLMAFFDKWEESMAQVSTQSTLADIARLIDVDSFIDFILITELAKSPDSYRRSAYLYKEPDASGGRVFAGPLWDFDIALGNAFSAVYPPSSGAQTFSSSELLMYDFFHPAAAPHNMASWWYSLLENEAFQSALACRWRALRNDVLSMAKLGSRIDAESKRIADAERRDHTRWPTIGKWIWGQVFVGATYSEEVEYLRRYLDERLKWLDSHLPGACLK